MTRRVLSRTLSLVLLASSLAACASGGMRHNTSVVSYLYPDGSPVVDSVRVPVLRLPIRLGIAFVPPAAHGNGYPGFGSAGDDAMPESERVRLMRRVTEHFRRQPIIRSVEEIPTAYLTPGGGFQNLEQLKAMFGVDVVVLLAYDQWQFTAQDEAAVTYLTLVGAFLVQGEKNDTRTLMDAAVVDVSSRRVLFRAPGTSTIKGRATPVNAEESQRADRLHGFQEASEDLVKNLERQLDAFKTRVREAPDEVTVVRSAEYDRRAAAAGMSAGAVDRTALLLAGLVALLALASGGIFRRGRR